MELMNALQVCLLLSYFQIYFFKKLFISIDNAFNDNEIIEIDDTVDEEIDCTLWTKEWSNDDDDCIILD